MFKLTKKLQRNSLPVDQSLGFFVLLFHQLFSALAISFLALLSFLFFSWQNQDFLSLEKIPTQLVKVSKKTFFPAPLVLGEETENLLITEASPFSESSDQESRQGLNEILSFCHNCLRPKHLQDNSIDSKEIQNKSITSSDIKTGQINSRLIQDHSIQSEDLASSLTLTEINLDRLTVGQGLPSHFTLSSGDAFIQNNLEIDGDAYFDRTLYVRDSSSISVMTSNTLRTTTANISNILSNSHLQIKGRLPNEDYLQIDDFLKVFLNPSQGVYIGATYDNIPAFSHIDGTNDLFIQDDLEVSGTIYGTISGDFSPSGNLDMDDNLILNIGNANTDFTSTGGLNLSGNVGIGTTSPTEKLDVSGNINISAGSYYKYDGVNFAMASVSLDNYFSGGAGNLTMTGMINTAFGSYSLQNDTTGQVNTAMGGVAMWQNTTGRYNSAMGGYTLEYNTTGNNNTALGAAALQYNVTGSDNTAIGYSAGGGEDVDLSDISQNTLIGSGVGWSLRTGGDGNILIGYSTGQSLTTGSRNIVIGYNINPPSATSTQTLNIGNLLYGTGLNGTGTTLSNGNIGIGTTNPVYKLDVNGNIAGDHIIARDNLYVGNGDKILSSTDNGNFSIGDNDSIFFNGTQGVWTNGGNVGIGTTSPGAKLEVLSSGYGNPSASYATTLANSNLRLGALTSGMGLSFGVAEGALSFWLQGQHTGGAFRDILLNPIAGNVGIGTTSPETLLEVYSTSLSKIITATSIRNVAGGGAQLRLQFARSGPAIVSSGDQIGVIQFAGYNGSAYDVGASIEAGIDGSPGGSGDMPTKLSFSTTPDGSATRIERLRITSSGNIGIGTTGPGAKLDILGDSGAYAIKVRGGSTSSTPFTVDEYGEVRARSLYLGSGVSGSNTFLGTVDTNEDLYIDPNGSGNVLLQPTSGNVGIGTTVPVSALHVIGSMRVDGASAAFGSATDGVVLSRGTGFGGIYGLDIGQAGSNDLQFFTSATPSMAITTTGNVGIGTTSPNHKLEVNGTTLFSGAAYFANTNVAIYQSSGDKLNYTASGGHIFNTGNVGIGTTGPQSELHISSSGSSELTIERLDATIADGNDIGSIDFRGGVSTITTIAKMLAEADQDWTDTASGSRLTFSTMQSNQVAGLTERMRITSTGNVGIGTTSPGYALEVVGTTKLGGAVSLTGGVSMTGNLNLNGNGVVSASYLRYTPNASLALNNTTHTSSIVAINGVANANIAIVPIYNQSASTGVVNTDLLINRTETSLGTTPGAQLLFDAQVGGTSRFVIQSNGNVGIGTTSPGYDMDVVGDINFTGTLYQNGVEFSSGSSQWTTAGLDIYYNIGNVGIGTTSPTAPLTLQGVNSTASSSAEMITNLVDRDFSGASNWTGTGWSLSGGGWAHTAGANNTTLSNSYVDPDPAGASTYQITFTAVTTVAGTLTPSFGGGSCLPVGQSTGTLTAYTCLVNASGNSQLAFIPNATWEGTLDDISVKLITPVNALAKLNNSDGSAGLEIRSGGIGLNNTFVGVASGLYNISGTNNVALGYQAGYFNVTGSDNSFFGYQAGYFNTIGTANSFIGNRAGYSNITGNNNVFLGKYSGYNNTTGSANIFVGLQTGLNNTSGQENTFLGYRTGEGNTVGNGNVFVGESAGSANSAGWANVYIGQRAGLSNTGGNRNTFMGGLAGQNSNTGSLNSFFGYGAGFSNQANSNTFLGTYAGLSNTGGDSNSIVGYFAGLNTQSGSANVIFGHEAGLGVSANSYSNNALIGYQSGYGLTTGSNNILLGYKSGDALTSGGNNILIGYDIDAQSATGSNQLSIGNLIFASGGFGTGTTIGAGNIGIGTTGPAVKLDVAGSINLTSGSNLTWGGIYGAGIPTIAGSSSSLRFYPNGSTSGESMRLGPTGGLSLGSAYLVTDPGAGSMIISGSVGIGTTSPLQKLHVVGGIGLDVGIAGANHYAIKPSPDQLSLGIGYTVGGNWYPTSGVPTLNVQYDGNVGIGTVVPDRQLMMVNPNDAPNYIKLKNRDSAMTTTNITGGLEIQTALFGTDSIWGLARIEALRTGNGTSDIIFSPSTGSMSPTERMRITSLGNVGIGTTSPARALHVNGSIRMGALIAGGGGAAVVYRDTNGDLATSTSSIRYKTEVANLESVLAEIMKLRAVRFEWNDQTSTPGLADYGMIAEEVNQVLPDLVLYDSDGTTPIGLKYEKMGLFALKGIQELEEKKVNLDLLVTNQTTVDQNFVLLGARIDQVEADLTEQLDQKADLSDLSDLSLTLEQIITDQANLELRVLTLENTPSPLPEEFQALKEALAGAKIEFDAEGNLKVKKINAGLLQLDENENPPVCGEEYKGALYFDVGEAVFFGCDGVSWKKMQFATPEEIPEIP